MQKSITLTISWENDEIVLWITDPQGSKLRKFPFIIDSDVLSALDEVCNDLVFDNGKTDVK